MVQATGSLFFISCLSSFSLSTVLYRLYISQKQDLASVTMHCTALLSILACCSVVLGRPGSGNPGKTNGSNKSNSTSDGHSNGKRAVGFYGNWV